MTARHSISEAKRVVVKIGSALLVDPERGTVHRKWLETLAEDIARMRGQGQEIIIVSSGAIALGRRYLGLTDGRLRLESQQAAAATGMIRLAHAYQEVLAHHDITVAQVLLTMDDSENRRRYINARNTLGELLKLNTVPLINENDTVATEEIRFGDNDRLAARVAAMISADLVVLLSDIDGLYSRDPRTNADASLVKEVRGGIPPEIEAMAGKTMSRDGSGGMATKLEAAKVAMGAGVRMIITDGTADHPLSRLENGASCTWFLPEVSPRAARKQWIAGSLKAVGAVVLDDGAHNALKSGKSLLPAGVVNVDGDFERGDAVIVRNSAGDEIARGLTAYSATDTRRIMGYKTSEIETLLGYRGRDELIHRDDLVLT